MARTIRSTPAWHPEAGFRLTEVDDRAPRCRWWDDPFAYDRDRSRRAADKRHTRWEVRAWLDATA